MAIEQLHGGHCGHSTELVYDCMPVNDKTQYYYEKCEKINSGGDDDDDVEKNIQLTNKIHKIEWTPCNGNMVVPRKKRIRIFMCQLLTYYIFLFGAIETFV